MAEAFINIHEKALSVSLQSNNSSNNGHAHLPLYLSGSGAPINQPLDLNVAWHPSLRFNHGFGYMPAYPSFGEVDGNFNSTPNTPSYPYIIPPSPILSPLNSTINSSSTITKDSPNDCSESPSTPTKALEEKENGDDKKDMKATPRGTRWKKEQLSILEQHYAVNKYPDKKDKCDIAANLEVTVSKVSSWFIGRRSREKRTAKRKENLDESMDSSEKHEAVENIAGCDLMDSPRRDLKNQFTQLMEKPPSDLINRRRKMSPITELGSDSGIPS